MPSRCEKDAASLPRARTIRPARVCRVVERAVVVEFGEQRIDPGPEAPLDDVGVEVASGTASQLPGRRGRGQCGAVGAVVGDRVVGVCDGEDACGEWYFFALEPVGVTGSVPGFVVVGDD